MEMRLNILLGLKSVDRMLLEKINRAGLLLLGEAIPGDTFN